MMDVIWFKRDVRLRDHGPLSQTISSSSSSFGRHQRQVLLLYLYEPDQLAENTVHGSHIHFINEGLQDLDNTLISGYKFEEETNNTKTHNHNHQLQQDQQQQHQLKYITLCYSEAVEAFESIHKIRPICRILAHEETGHWTSYQRDIRVRKWCRKYNIQFIEYEQSGVKRCLKHRNDFSKQLKLFMNKPLYPMPNIKNLTRNIVINLNIPKIQCNNNILLYPKNINEIPNEYKNDRIERQHGGETIAHNILQTFLLQRSSNYSNGISSPNSSWNSCSRLSPYLSWGHVSIRLVIHQVKRRQIELKSLNNQKSGWNKSLTSFLSRMHWRSHFIQKLESEPEIEKRDMCIAYQPLRRQLNDWNEDYYQCWVNGTTGYPFVDACMRCLHRHGWINFRMRAMLVSFATWNLWLDWKRIAPHLGRCFLDYEPGIHYPQLQMQAGTTGINAMRVYNVTKQGKDHDPDGIFIKKYIPELKNVPKKYIHEPWKMSCTEQEQYGIKIIIKDNNNNKNSQVNNTTTNHVMGNNNNNNNDSQSFYPYPIVDEKISSKIAKDRVSKIRNQESTKVLAKRVYEEHGSRTHHRDNVRGIVNNHHQQQQEETKLKTLRNNKKRRINNNNMITDGQKNIRSLFSKNNNNKNNTPCPSSNTQINNKKKISMVKQIASIEVQKKSSSLTNIAFFMGDDDDKKKKQQQVQTLPNLWGKKKNEQAHHTTKIIDNNTINSLLVGNNNSTIEISASTFEVDEDEDKHINNEGWNCIACTFLNRKLLAPVCEVCGTKKKEKITMK